jgi:hypothetical protein
VGLAARRKAVSSGLVEGIAPFVIPVVGKDYTAMELDVSNLVKD